MAGSSHQHKYEITVTKETPGVHNVFVGTGSPIKVESSQIIYEKVFGKFDFKMGGLG